MSRFLRPFIVAAVIAELLSIQIRDAKADLLRTNDNDVIHADEETEVVVPAVTCDGSATSCEITFRIHDESFAFKMYQEDQSVFANELTIGLSSKSSSENDDPLRDHHLRNLVEGSRRYVAKSALDGGLATASIIPNKERGGFEVRHGFFMVHGEWIEFGRGGEKRFSFHASGDGQRKLQQQSSYWRNWRGAPATDPIVFVNPNRVGSCYPSDNYMHIAIISVALDMSFYESVVGTQVLSVQTAVAPALQSLSDLASLAQLIWSAQLNIKLVISHVEIGDLTSAAPLNESKNQGTCLDAMSAFYTMRDNWLPSRNPKYRWGGTTVLVSNCFSSDVGGAAEVGTFCRGSMPGVAVTGLYGKDFAHELGHTFGATHSFENGVGTTGGIMDYGSGFYLGVQQFHPKKQSELCALLSAVKTNGCPQLVQSTNSATVKQCGDGILGPDEQCECLDQSLACGSCIQCKLAAPAECSTLFALRRAQDRGYVKLTKDMISSPECCSSNNVAAIATSCNGGLDMCSFGGFCTPICRNLGLMPCGTDYPGCRQKCMITGLCVDVSTRMTARNVTLNAVIDGTTCRSMDPLRHVRGQCGNGLCMFNGTVETTSSPTIRPTSPSKPPSTISPTLYPTLAPTIVDCTSKKRKNLCVSPCTWCNNKAGCQLTCLPGMSSKKTSTEGRKGRRRLSRQ